MATLINGVNHSWSSVSLMLLGSIPNGVTEIDYEENKEKVNNYGMGAEPVSRGYGKKDYKASITLTSKEVDAIQAKLPKGNSLTDIAPFEIAITYKAEGEPLLTKHKLLACEFKNNARAAKQGDTSIDVKLELIIGGINWSV